MIEPRYSDWRQLRKIFFFARKWDCPQILYIFRLYLSDVVGRMPSCCEQVFIIAGLMDDITLCKRAIAFYLDDRWAPLDDDDDDDDDTYLVGETSMKPSTWTYSDYITCPPSYAWALQRVFDVEEAKRRDEGYDEDHEDDDDNEARSHRRVDHFSRLMQHPKGKFP